MSQPLLDLVQRFGGAQAVSAMAARVGLSPEDTQSAIAAVMPALAGGMANHVAAQGPAALDEAATPASTFAVGEGVASDASVEHGSGLLGSIFGSHDAAGAVVSHAAGATGIDAGKLAALLPMIATLAAGALGQAGSGATPVGGLGGMLGSVLGGQGSAANVLTSLLGGGAGNALDNILDGRR